MSKITQIIRWFSVALISMVILTFLGSSGIFANSDVFVIRTFHSISMEISSWVQSFPLFSPTSNDLLEKVVGGGAGTP